MCGCGISFSEAHTLKRVALFVKSTGYKNILLQICYAILAPSLSIEK
jgi:hypothetical protein